MDEHSIAGGGASPTQVERLTGEIDIATAPQLSRRFSAVPNTVSTLIVDLSEVTFLDSAGIQLLHQLHDRLRTRDAELIVVSPPGTSPRRVLDLTAFDARVTLRDSLPEVWTASQASS